MIFCKSSVKVFHNFCIFFIFFSPFIIELIYDISFTNSCGKLHLCCRLSSGCRYITKFPRSRIGNCIRAKRNAAVCQNRCTISQRAAIPCYIRPVAQGNTISLCPSVGTNRNASSGKSIVADSCAAVGSKSFPWQIFVKIAGSCVIAYGNAVITLRIIANRSAFVRCICINTYSSRVTSGITGSTQTCRTDNRRCIITDRSTESMRRKCAHTSCQSAIIIFV